MTAVLEGPDAALDTRFAPAPPPARFAPPPSNVNPDVELSWWRRMMPIVLAHKFIVLTGLGCALLTLLLQLALPRLIRFTFDRAIIPEIALRLQRRGAPLPDVLSDALRRVDGKPTPLMTYFLLLAGIAAARYVIGYIYRYNLQRTSFAIEFDLRNIIYEKFQRLSFAYFD